MSFGTIYTLPISPRSSWLPGLAKYLGLDVSFIPMKDVENYKDKFPLGQAPAFESPSGFKLTELMAIVEYLVLSSDKKEILGVSPEEKASSTRWESFANTTLATSMIKYWFAKAEDEKSATLEGIAANLKYLDGELANSKYLAGDKVLMGDIFAYTVLATIAHLGVSLKEYSNVSRFVAEVAEHPILKD